MDYCKDRDVEVNNESNLSNILRSYIHPVIRATGLDREGHANKVSCNKNLKLPEIKDKLQLLHFTMIGWGKDRPIQQKNSCRHKLAFGHVYFLCMKSRFDKSCAVFVTFDNKLRHRP